MMDYEKFCRRFLRRLLRMRRELYEFIVDVQWWNDNRLDAPPFDIESDQLALAKLEAMIDLVRRRQQIPKALWDEFCKHQQESADGWKTAPRGNVES